MSKRVLETWHHVCYKKQAVTGGWNALRIVLGMLVKPDSATTTPWTRGPNTARLKVVLRYARVFTLGLPPPFIPRMYSRYFTYIGI